MNADISATVVLIARLARDLAELIDRGAALVTSAADKKAHRAWRESAVAMLENASRREREIVEGRLP